MQEDSSKKIRFKNDTSTEHRRDFLSQFETFKISISMMNTCILGRMYFTECSIHFIEEH